MNLSRIFRRRNPARDLALIGAEQRRRRIIERTRQLCVELSMEPHPALERGARA